MSLGIASFESSDEDDNFTIISDDDDKTHLRTNVCQIASFHPMNTIFVSTCSCEKGEKCEKRGIEIGIILTILESNRLTESLILSFGWWMNDENEFDVNSEWGALMNL